MLVSKKDLELIKSGLRRAFSRSEIRRDIIADTIIDHVDKTRPRVKTWCMCPKCTVPTPKSYMEVDHIHPVVGIKETLQDLTPTDLVVRIWCNKDNLRPICETCHKLHTKYQNSLRRMYRKGRNGGTSKQSKVSRRAA